MKKSKRSVLSALALLLAALMLSCAISCGKKPAGDPATDNTPLPEGVTAEPNAAPSEKPIFYDPETDYDNRYGMGYDCIVETEDAYYCCASYSSRYLFYYDKASGERGVLCSKPECMHDAGGTDCSGLIEMCGASLNYWDGRLHYLAIDRNHHCYAFFSVALDGSDKRMDTLADTSPIEIQGATMPQRLDYHRGKCYGWRYYEEVENSELFNCIDVVSADPQTGETRLILKEKLEVYPTEPKLYYHGNYVYISYNIQDYEELEDHVEVLSNILCIYRWNIETEELEEVLRTELLDIGEKGSGFRLYIDAEERIWTAPVYGEQTVYTIESGALCKAFLCDNPWSCFMLDGAAAVFSMPDMALEVRRLDGSLIYEGVLDTSFIEELDTSREYELDSYFGIYGDAEAIYISFVLDAKDQERAAYCLVRYDLTGGTPKPEIIACLPGLR
ncbi:MAG: hypothetical protein J5772_02095 [Clostridia bacterium]|nr:hypothetical protein [Clostridia bacterium]